MSHVPKAAALPHRACRNQSLPATAPRACAGMVVLVLPPCKAGLHSYAICSCWKKNATCSQVGAELLALTRCQSHGNTRDCRAGIPRSAGKHGMASKTKELLPTFSLPTPATLLCSAPFSAEQQHCTRFTASNQQSPPTCYLRLCQPTGDLQDWVHSYVGLKGFCSLFCPNFQNTGCTQAATECTRYTSRAGSDDARGCWSSV